MNGKVTIDSVSVANNGSQLFLSMTLDVSKLKVKSDGEVHLSPVIALNADSLYLPQIILAGRGRHYRILRNNITFGEGELYRAGKTKRIHYRAVVPMATWMENANLVLNEDVYGCLCKLKDDSNDLLATFDFSPKTYQPHLVFVAPKAEAPRSASWKDRPTSTSRWIKPPSTPTIAVTVPSWQRFAPPSTRCALTTISPSIRYG